MPDFTADAVIALNVRINVENTTVEATWRMDTSAEETIAIEASPEPTLVIKTYPYIPEP